MNQLPLHKRIQIINLLVEGNSINATARIVDVSSNTVSKLLAQVGSFCFGFHNARVINIPARRVQCDEIWSYIYCKEKNVRHDLRGKGVAGDVWTWTAIDADTKLIISWHVGNREIDSGLPFMRDLAKRVINRIQLTTDGLHLYPNVIEEAFGARADYAYLKKSYGMEFTKERRYSAQYIKSITKTIMSGSPDPDHISTSLVERQNLTMRMSMRRFTRLSNGFSKKLIYHKYMIALYFVYYNFCRIHSTIRITPAMEAGLTNDILKIEDLITLADE